MTNTKTRRLLLLIGSLAIAAGSLPSLPAQAQSCPNSTINVGTYAFHGHGFANHGQSEFPVPAGAALPVALQGNITFNEDGSISGKQRAAVGDRSGQAQISLGTTP